MSTTDLKYAEVHFEEYRNCCLLLLIHVFGSEQRSKAFIFVVLAPFIVLFHVRAVLQGRLTATMRHALTVLLLWHLNDREMFIVAWHVLKYIVTPRLQDSFVTSGISA